MPPADEVEIVPIRRLDDVLDALLAFDADSQRINFPRDAPDRGETERRIRREFEEEPGGMHVVLARGTPIGCLFLKTRHNPFRRCDYLDLRNIYLAADHRGKGIGRKLLEFMEAYARRKGCKYLYLGTAYDNEDARRLFEGFGFRPTRVIMERDIR
ncbi:MAG TPA: GNAT family N-acetyltransferase [Thermoplasmata archaeon]|jgi:GNAT superfamily N-acetyltransferase|nr:GNAT family N-acetyltransferase [Thermoplasmata archaeon]